MHTVHVTSAATCRGSATRAVDNCAPAAYARSRLSLSAAPVPVYSLPGDNDWPTCPDPAAGWALYRLATTRQNTTAAEYHVKRQPRRDENFAFLYRRVLFVGLHVVANSADAEETRSRLEDNVAWVSENIAAYGDRADVVFVMGYGRLLAAENAPFYEALRAMQSMPGWDDKLLVYARRAGASSLEKDVGGLRNFVELRVGNEWPIMDVRVRTATHAVGVGGATTTRVDYRDAFVEED